MPSGDSMRILNMLAEGKISADEAASLLDSLENDMNAEPEIVLKDKRGRKPNKLKIEFSSDNSPQKTNGSVNIPISLIKILGPIAKNAIPNEAKNELEKQGIDIMAILQDLDNLMRAFEESEEDIVNVNSGDGVNSTKVRVYFE